MPGRCTLSTLVVLSCPAPQHQLPLSMPLKTHKLKHPARPHQRLPSHGSIRTAPGRGSLPLRDSSCRSSSDRVLTSSGSSTTRFGKSHLSYASQGTYCGIIPIVLSHVSTS